jgi:hypothetical protein
MKKVIGLIIFVLAFNIQIKAQSLAENEIIGKWSVVQINVLTKIPDEQKKTVDRLKDAFLRSTFEFNPDHTFVFDFEIEKMRIQTGSWKYNDDSKSFIIQDWKDRETNNWKLMEINIRKEDNKIIFELHDVFVELVMNKEY